jgi:hypothetical protein
MNFGTYQPILALGPELAEVDHGALAGDVRLVVGGVTRRPHLEHGVDAAVVEADPGGVLVDVDDLHRCAELGLDDRLGDVGVDRRTGPRVDREVMPSPVAACRCHSAVVVAGRLAVGATTCCRRRTRPATVASNTTGAARCRFLRMCHVLPLVEDFSVAP